MKELEQRIMEDGRVRPGEILLVDGFINQGIDVTLMSNMAKVWRDYFNDKTITKVMTIEASGIAVAVLVAQELNVPALFAKKYETVNLTDDRHCARVYSYTRGREYTIAVSKRLLSPDDHVLLVDDFLANGCAIQGLVKLVRSAGATIEGVGIVIEKAFQKGGKILRDQGLDVCSLARIAAFEDDRVILGEADA